MNYETANRIEFFEYTDGSVEVFFTGNVPADFEAATVASLVRKGMVESLQKRDRSCRMRYMEPTGGPVTADAKGRPIRRIAKSKKVLNVGEMPRVKKPIAKSSRWANHNPIPKPSNADYVRPPKGDNALANQLAELLVKRNALGSGIRQATDEELFGHLVVTQEQAEAMEKSWTNSFNNFFNEATKPLPGSSSGWEVTEDARAYWDSIKVNDKDE